MAQALTQRAILLSSAARYFPPQTAFLKLFYKNGDANSCLRWDDSPLLSAACPVGRCVRIGHSMAHPASSEVHIPRGKTCRVKHSRILSLIKLTILKARILSPLMLRANPASPTV
ncbi:hypothetical protein FZI19_11215 [Cronobacter muytjensii]|uniref:Uncharacterized protein n=1 Tax=Cronobacter muytjensii TaxID=413501 RepID=A0ABQ6TZH0_9ENTR|nr:hypothetical protein FZI19_11215 [Cronobacter muytjensii]